VLEQQLRSGDIVTFDGRILEVFPASGRCERLHVAHVEPVRVVDDDGASRVTFGGAQVGVRFAREEAPACARLLAAISEARRSYA
jgi:hypothetical protein